MTLPRIIVIAGPTASGKSSLALQVAQRLPAEIVSADSRQIFRHLDIGTAKPSPAELSLVPHHFVDVLTPDVRFTAGDFQVQGRKVIAEILNRGRLPIIAGGTGLYIRAIVDGFFEAPEGNGEVREQLEARLIADGKQSLYDELLRVDPAAAATMDASKHRRVIRALEVFQETGIPISRFHAMHSVTPVYDAHFFALLWERRALYDRIEHRVDSMLKVGFLEEVERIAAMGFDDRFQSLQTVGYKEAFAYRKGEITYPRMVELMKQNTRRFAKRQLTWFRKEERIRWFPITAEEQIPAIAEEIIHLVK